MAGHEWEYVVVLLDLNDDEYIPGEIEDEIQRALGEDWRVGNCGTRPEIVNNKKFGLRDDLVVFEGVKKVLSRHGYQMR